MSISSVQGLGSLLRDTFDCSVNLQYNPLEPDGAGGSKLARDKFLKRADYVHTDLCNPKASAFYYLWAEVEEQRAG